MNLAEFSLKRPTSIWVLTVLFFVGGFYMFNHLGRLEDPEFTIKEAVVSTAYPGASAKEVAEEVTDVLEEAIQAMGQIKEVRSISKSGLSIIYAKMQDKYDGALLPQVWDELRRKVGDAQGDLPPGVMPSLVNDDFGDVFGVFFALGGDGYSLAELHDFAKLLKRELLLVSDVAKVKFWGVQQEAIFVEMSRARMSQLGISPDEVYATLGLQNQVANSGRVKVGAEHIRLDPTGLFDSVEDVRNILIRGGGTQNLVYLRDVAEVYRDYQEPPRQLLFSDGTPAIGIGISSAAGGNVVTMGEAIKKRLEELKTVTPVGMELGVISMQSDDVTTAVDGFVINLVEAILIVLVVLMLFMGFRSALLIGGILLITIVATFLIMGVLEITLQRISLGALIIALGMLVDNAIVVVEGILIGAQKGLSKAQAAIDTVAQTATPLLGATVVAIMAFAAIGLSQDGTGEFCRALFQVVLISLGLSWLFAVTVTPLAGILILPEPKGETGDPYAGKFYQLYRGVLDFCVHRRFLTLAVTVGMFLSALYGFGYVSQSFFPDSTRGQFYVDYWRPEGTHIRDTAADVQEIAAWTRELEGVTATASFVGQGALRFLLTYTAEDVNSAFGHIIITVDDYRRADTLGEQIQSHIAANYPDAQAWYKKFIVGPGGGAKIEARFRGPDAGVLRRLSEQAKAIIRDDPAAVNVRDDWRQRVKVVRPIYNETPARISGVTRPDLAAALESAFDGRSVGIYREGEELLPIISRAPLQERSDVYNLNNVQVWSSGAQRALPASQILAGVEVVSEDQLIRRFNRVPAIMAQADQGVGTAESLRRRIALQIEALEMPPGYEFEWKGEYGNSKDAQVALNAKLPPTFIGMVLIVVLLFDRLRQPLVIYLTVPLALIGVTIGLLVTDQPFGFMTMLGLLSLSGMLIKNAIVLIDEIDLNRRGGIKPYEAVITAGVSRMRPVMMAALTTMLGMIPLFADAFFVAMAVTIVFGLGFATVLTLIVVPTLYATVFGIHEDTAPSAV